MALKCKLIKIHPYHIYAQTIHVATSPTSWDTYVKYLGVHLDRRLTWRKHIRSKRYHLDHQLRKLYWIIGRKSQLFVENKLHLYKALLNLSGPMGSSYGERRQPPTSKSSKGLNPKHSESSRTHPGRIAQHPNRQTPPLIQGPSYPRRLKRKDPQDLQTVV
jgi:hypothetical protein